MHTIDGYPTRLSLPNNVVGLSIHIANLCGTLNVFLSTKDGSVQIFQFGVKAFDEPERVGEERNRVCINGLDIVG